MRLVILLFVFLISCNSSEQNLNELSSSEKSADSNQPEKQVMCCMESLDEFSPFLPVQVGSFKSKGKVVGNLFCLDDREMHSQGSRSYYDENEEKFRVMIRDYCSKDISEFEHLGDANNNPSLKDSEGELKIIKNDIATGYAKYYKEDPNLNSGNPAEVSVIIDGRFYVSIKAQDQKSVSQVMSLYEGLPIANLASFKK